MLPRMRGIDYNVWMSILAHFTEKMPLISSDYGMGGKTIAVLPSYPKDLTKFTKPSIIVQKIHTMQSGVGFGNYLGQYTDIDGTKLDVRGKIHEMIYQINVEGNSNTECSLLTALLTEGILDRIHDYDDPWIIELRDYIDDVKNPQPVGRIDIIGIPDITPMSANDNEDYINAVRCTLRVVQTIINDNHSIIDLGKPIKWTTNINL